jgi:hypothetical protein
MRTTVLALLLLVLLAVACGDGSADTAPTSTTTTTESSTVDYGPDAAAVARFYAAGETWPLHLRADAVLQIDDQTIGILDPIAQDAVEDWDGDGTITNGDYLSRTAVSRRVFQTVLDVECVPEGVDLLCTVGQTDLLYNRAGVAGPAFQQRFRVAEGLITALSLPAVQVGAEAEAAEEAWMANLASFERWLNGNHPADYGDLFRGPCCPSNLEFTPANAARIELLLIEWNREA